MPPARTRRRALPALAVVVVLAGGLALAASLRPSVSGGTAAKPVPSATPGKTAGTHNQGQRQGTAGEPDGTALVRLLRR